MHSTFTTTESPLSPPLRGVNIIGPLAKSRVEDEHIFSDVAFVIGIWLYASLNQVRRPLLWGSADELPKGAPSSWQNAMSQASHKLFSGYREHNAAGRTTKKEGSKEGGWKQATCVKTT